MVMGGLGEVFLHSGTPWIMRFKPVIPRLDILFPSPPRIAIHGFQDGKGQHCMINSTCFGEIMAGERWRYAILEKDRKEGGH